MAAFHPATVRLLRRDLADLATQHKQDLARLARLKVESKSQMAQKLRDRIADSVPVMRDLERILPPVHDPGVPSVAEPDERAQWLADGRKLLDFIEANPNLPLPNSQTTYTAFPVGTDEEERDEVFRAAELLGIKATEDTLGHLQVEHTIGRHAYQVVAISVANMGRFQTVRRLGEAVLAAQEAGEPA